jgi:hypothetical protein
MAGGLRFTGLDRRSPSMKTSTTHARFFCAIALAGIRAGAMAAPAPESADRIQARLVGLTQELMDAIPTGNAQAWQRILSDDALLIDEFGRRQDKKEIVAGIHPFPTGFSGSIEIRAARTSVHGDTAVLQGEFYERESVFEQKLVVRYLFSNTFVRADGDWKLVASTDVTLPTTPPALHVEGLVPTDYAGVYSYGPGRAFTVITTDGKLSYTTKAGGKPVMLGAIAKDVFMDDGDEKNLLIFRRDASGHVNELIERRKFNDLHMMRGAASVAH